jgi:hypothetical protein
MRRQPLLFGLALIILGGCGRKATEADCQLIVDQNVSVQMKALNITDPAAIAKKQDELKLELSGDMKDCVGRRVSDSMMACVKGAQTTDEIQRCLR